MARRPGDRGLSLSPRARRIAGWVAAVVLVAGIAIGVRLVGGSGDGSPGGGATASASASEALPITFGTSLDPATGLVATASRTTRFADGETFAYAVPGLQPPPATVYVKVERIEEGEFEVVQPPAQQAIAAGAAVTAFSVPAAALLEAFGPGEYRMRVYLAPSDQQPAAEGTFSLVREGPLPSG